MSTDAQITAEEFGRFQRLIYELAGIALSDAKKILLVGRLGRRLRHHGMSTYSQYYRYVTSGEDPGEMQQMVDLLTTNETYFFREPTHFEFLESLARAHPSGKGFRIWSGASSSGEEAYTMAMVLAETLGNLSWEVFGSDISLTVLARARAGVYPLERANGIPPALLKKYCLKGVRSQAGSLLIDRALKARVRFEQVNLTRPVSGVGQFDVIFLRNVMIYFDADTKRKVIAHMLPCLNPGGHFIVGHSESLTGLSNALTTVRPTIYRKPIV